MVVGEEDDDEEDESDEEEDGLYDDGDMYYQYKGKKYPDYDLSLLLSTILQKKINKKVQAQKKVVAVLPNPVTETIKIGNQEWMLHNLNVTQFNDGTKIKEVKIKNTWKNSSQKKGEPTCCFVDFKAENEKYGRLYNWYTITGMKGTGGANGVWSGLQADIVPVGFRVPTPADWEEFRLFFADINTDKEKEKLLKKWLGSDENIESINIAKCFLPGFCDNEGFCEFINHSGMFWCFVDPLFSDQKYFSISTRGEMGLSKMTPAFGLSVRGIKIN